MARDAANEIILVFVSCPFCQHTDNCPYCHGYGGRHVQIFIEETSKKATAFRRVGIIESLVRV